MLTLWILALSVFASPTPAVRRHGEVIVQYRAPVPATWAASTTPLAPQGVALVHFDEDRVPLETITARLQADPAVRRVEPNLILWTSHADWRHRDLRSAQDPMRATWAAPQPWTAHTVRLPVGILDTGIDTDHPDLRGAVRPGVNLVDPSAMHGAEANDPTAMDYNGHGTQVAGIIGARHNGFGIDGLNDHVDLVPIKVFDQDGTGALADVLRGIAWARAQHLAVLNMSFGTYENSALLGQAIADALQDGMLVVAAAGNDGAGTVTYPAAYPGVLAIGSSDSAGISRFSNFGPRVDYYAPGNEVLSTTSQRQSPNPYAPLNGTSAAAAHATGVLTRIVQRGQDPRLYMEERSPWRLADRRLGEARYRVLGTERIVHDLERQPLRALSALRWDLPTHSPDGQLPITVTLQNTGNQPLAASTLQLELRHDATRITLPLGPVPALDPGAAPWEHTWRVAVPQAALQATGQAGLQATPQATGQAGPEATPQAQAWVARLRSDTAPLDSGPRDLTIGGAPHAALTVQAMWLTPFNRAAMDSPRVHARLTNPGSAPSPAAVLRVSAIPAVHEGIWSVPAQPITAAQTVPSLAPGAWTDVELPSSAPLPPSDNITLLADVSDADGQELGRAIQSFHFASGGQAHLLYNQAAHMGSVQAAVDLLLLQNIVIPDVHLDDRPYLGTPETARDYGSAVRVGVRNWHWDWASDWPEYPQSSKHLLDGASACDGIDVAFGDGGVSTWDTHYWIVDEHDEASLGSHSALTKVLALVLGGYGSNIPDGAIAAYRAGDKSRAWWLMGHAAHLIGDLSTGAHSINRNWHGVVGDPYHDWMGQDGHYRAWPGSTALNVGGMLDLYQGNLLTTAERLRFLTYSTAQIGSSFPWHRMHGWLPTHGETTGVGNRTIAGDYPHYDDAMAKLFSRFAAHPLTLRDLNADEVMTARGQCAAPRRRGSSDTFADCWDGGDDHVDRNNIETLDADGDLSTIADASYVHALRAIAGLIYVFAVETGQIAQ